MHIEIIYIHICCIVIIAVDRARGGRHLDVQTRYELITSKKPTRSHRTQTLPLFLKNKITNHSLDRHTNLGIFGPHGKINVLIYIHI